MLPQRLQRVVSKVAFIVAMDHRGFRARDLEVAVWSAAPKHVVSGATD